MSDGQTSPNCNTFNATGFHLGDLDYIRNRVREAIHYVASHPDDVTFARNLLPWWFPCSHCGTYHQLSIQDMHNALFNGPGAIDKMAAMDEFKAIIEKKLASAAGVGQRNAVARTAEIVLADFFGEEDPAITLEKEDDDSTDGSTDNTSTDQQPVQDSGPAVQPSK